MTHKDIVGIIEQGKSLSLIGSRFETIATAIKQTDNIKGEIWECGCYRGGTALLMKSEIGDRPKIIRMFDTFEGMPFFDKDYDIHQLQAFSRIDCNYNIVRNLFLKLDNCFVYKGIMPDTFIGLENSNISVAHIDVDNYQSVKLCLEWIYPRVHSQGWIIIDDYNSFDCRGAKKAVDDFVFKEKESLIIPKCENPSKITNPQVYIVKKII